MNDDKKWSSILSSASILECQARAQARYLALTLTELADYYKSDKGTIKHRYCETYELYLSSLKNRPINLLEMKLEAAATQNVA